MRRRRVPLLFALAFLALSALPGSSSAIICPVLSDFTPQCCLPPPAAAPDVMPQCCTTACSGTTVTLWQKLPSQSTFTRVGQATTNSVGDYKIVRGAGAVQTNTTWYATASGATSATWLQQVRALLKLAATPPKPARCGPRRAGGRSPPTVRVSVR